MMILAGKLGRGPGQGPAETRPTVFYGGRSLALSAGKNIGALEWGGWVPFSRCSELERSRSSQCRHIEAPERADWLGGVTTARWSSR